MLIKHIKEKKERLKNKIANWGLTYKSYQTVFLKNLGIACRLTEWLWRAVCIWVFILVRDLRLKLGNFSESSCKVLRLQTNTTKIAIACRILTRSSSLQIQWTGFPGSVHAQDITSKIHVIPARINSFPKNRILESRLIIVNSGMSIKTYL